MRIVSAQTPPRIECAGVVGAGGMGMGFVLEPFGKVKDKGSYRRGTEKAEGARRMQ